jgi:hypothetical protein
VIRDVLFSRALAGSLVAAGSEMAVIDEHSLK